MKPLITFPYSSFFDKKRYLEKVFSLEIACNSDRQEKQKHKTIPQIINKKTARTNLTIMLQSLLQYLGRCGRCCFVLS